MRRGGESQRGRRRRLATWLGGLAALLAVGPATAQPLFPGQKFMAGEGVSDVAVADLDGDGIPDVATANELSGDVSALLGNGDTTFREALSFASGLNTVAIAVGDFDGDGVLDLVAANRGEPPLILPPPIPPRPGVPGDLSVFRGNGDGSFQAAVALPAGDNPTSVAVADLDDNGILDLVAADPTGENVNVLLGNGDGSFQAAAPFPAASQPSYVAVADLDGDAVPDVVATGDGVISVLLGNGDGTFQAADSFLGGGPSDFSTVAVADLDGDALPDLVVPALRDLGSGPEPGVDVLLGNGDGTFQAPLFTPSLGLPGSIAVADLDADGVPDLATAGFVPFSSGPSIVGVLLGSGDGSFWSSQEIPAGPLATAVALADLDADGALDLVNANSDLAPGFRRVAGDVRVFPGNADGSFPAPAILPAGFIRAASIAVADLDGDDIPDLATGHPNPGRPPTAPPGELEFGYVSVLFGNGDGSFEDASFLDASLAPTAVALADLDGDGAIDLAVSNASLFLPAGVTIRLGNGDGSFGPITTFPVPGSRPRSLAVVDLDGDTVPDLVTVNEASNDVSVLLGNGDGSFGAGVSYPTGSQPRSLAVADFDADSAPDVAVVAGSPPVIDVLLGNGDGSLEAPLSLAAGGSPSAVAAGDLDGDGAPDLVTAGSRVTSDLFDGEVNALLGNGDGSFQPAVGFAVDSRFLQAVAVADLDGDGAPDVVTGNGTEDVAVLPGNGDGSFGPAALYGVGLDPVALVLSDLDGDRRPDVATASREVPPGVTVLLQLPDPLLRPEIDIRPRRKLNLVKPGSRRPIPVALLGSEDLDVHDVDPHTLAFGPAGAAPLRFVCEWDGWRRAKYDKGDDDFGIDCRSAPYLKDVNRDGFADLVSHYRTNQTGIAIGDTQACLAGELTDGTPFEGCDVVTTLPFCGLGFEVALLLPGLAWLRRRRTRRSMAGSTAI